MKMIIGIDPSATHGAIVTMCEDGRVDSIVKMPPTPQDIYEHLSEIKELHPNAVCYLEDVGHGLPGQSSSATAKFARHCGHLEMALIASKIKTVKVLPNKWEKTYSLGKSREYSKTEWKNRLKAKAQELFPDEKITLATCDALLIAEYGRQKEK